jgi:hypothetical protein
LGIQSRLIEYGEGDTAFEGMLVWDDSFTNPAANDTECGTVYDAQADKRSWIAMKNFLAEQFE